MFITLNIISLFGNVHLFQKKYLDYLKYNISIYFCKVNLPNYYKNQFTSP
jgi:hypothetical protein